MLSMAHLIKGQATVSQSVDQFELTQPTTSSHLKTLERAGPLLSSRKAQTRPCILNVEGFKAIDACLKSSKVALEGNYVRPDSLLDDLKGKAQEEEE